MSKCISVLGSTGSIGRQTLQVARELGLKVAALTAGKQIDLLEQQARQFRPCLAAVYEEAAARELRERGTVAVTTTTKIWPPTGIAVAQDPDTAR